VTIVTTVTTATTLFELIFPAVNGFCWANGFLFVLPTFSPARESAPFFYLAQFSPAALHPIRARADALLGKLSPRSNPSGGLVFIL
jgi:hypothetical protein